MADVFDRGRRSDIMRQIRSSDTQPELVVRSYLHRAGFRFRLHAKQLPGKPDIVLPRLKTVIEVHGCLWHGHKNCRRGRRPKSNIDYWNRKIDGNIARDTANAKLLRKIGWRRLVVWECGIISKPEPTMRRLISWLNRGID